MALQLVTVADSISHITVTGVTICDVDQIPASTERMVPVLYPNPDGFITNMSITRDSAGGASALMSAYYTLNYMFAYASAGAGRIGLDLYDDMVTKACAIMDAVFDKFPLTGTVSFDLEDALNFGVFQTPAGNDVLGCEFKFRIMEFIH